MFQSQFPLSCEFQTVGPAIEKARFRNVQRRNRGIFSLRWLAKRRC